MTDKKGKSGGQSEDKTLIRKDEGARHGGVQDKHTVDDTHQPPKPPLKYIKPFSAKTLLINVLFIIFTFSGVFIQTSYACLGMDKLDFMTLIEATAEDKNLKRHINQIQFAHLLIDKMYEKMDTVEFIGDPYVKEFKETYDRANIDNMERTVEELYQRAVNGEAMEKLQYIMLTPMINMLYLKLYADGTRAMLYGKKRKISELFEQK